MDMASRHCGLNFGRFPFEFGISGSAGSDHGSREPPFPIWRGTTALLEWYYRSSGTAAVVSRYYGSCGTAAVGSRYYCWMPVPSFPTKLGSLLLFCLVAYALFFRVFLLVVCLVPGDDHPEQRVRRVNPGRATSKRYRTSEPAGGSSSTQPPLAGASSSAPPPPQQSKRSANKPKGKDCD